MANMLVLGAIGLGLFLWEHFGRVLDLSFRPTIGINTIIDILESFFTAIGSFFAKISSYLCWIKFQDLWITITDLYTSLFNLMTSPIYVIKGYVDTALGYIDSTYKIYIGSFLLIAIVLYVIYRYRLSIPLVRSINIEISSKHIFTILFLCVIIFLVTSIKFDSGVYLLPILASILVIVAIGITIININTH